MPCDNSCGSLFACLNSQAFQTWGESCQKDNVSKRLLLGIAVSLILIRHCTILFEPGSDFEANEWSFIICCKLTLLA